jgi:hypothetical protein
MPISLKTKHLSAKNFVRTQFFISVFKIFGYAAWTVQLGALFLRWVRRGSAGSAWLSRCGVAQFGCDVAQSGAEWPSRAQFGSVNKGVGLLEGRF